MSDRAARAITNAVLCMEYAARQGWAQPKIDAALDNARQALAYAEAHDPTPEQRQIIRRMKVRLTDTSQQDTGS